MNELIQEIAKTFNIGNEAVQGVIQNYPQLRQQVVVYNITTTIQSFAFVAIIATAITFLFALTSTVTSTIEAAESRYGREASKVKAELFKKITKCSLFVLVASTIMFIAMTTLQSVYSPDIVVIKELMTHVK